MAYRSTGISLSVQGGFSAVKRFVLAVMFVFFLSLWLVPSALADVLMIPAEVQEIEEEAFYGNQSLDEVVLPGNIKRIESKAFSKSSVKKVNLPDSIEFIADDAFDSGADINMTANPGTTAYAWAVEHGYIKTTDIVIPSNAGDFEYTDNGDGTCTVTKYIGDNKENIVIPKWNTEGKLVTRIGDQAFFFRYDLQGSLIIPDSVIEIGKEAFFSCPFTGSLTIPASVTSIGDSAFDNCHHFTGNLTLPDGLISIGDGAFSSCDGFTGNLTIPASVISIGESAFSGCSRFTGDLMIPDSVTSIGDSAFSRCSGFNGSLTVSENVTSIGNAVFSECSGFKGNLSLPDSVTSIGWRAFENCLFDGKLSLPDGLISIGDWAFSGCHCFTGDLIIPDSVTSIGGAAFNDCSGFNGRLSLSESVVRIDGDTFSGCSGFTGRLVIPESVTEIQHDAFADCIGFTNNLSIPNNVTYIAKYAFKNCSGFNGSLMIPNSSTGIHNDTFDGCVNLKKVAVSITNSDGTVSEVLRTAVYCPQSSRAWSWAESKAEFEPVEWDGDYSVLPEDTQLYGAFTDESIILTLGEQKKIPAGYVKSIGQNIYRVTITVSGYEMDDPVNNRYATDVFVDHHTKEVNLTDWAAFYLDTTRAPFNEPGEYTINLWASITEGEGVLLDSASVTVVTKLAAPNITYPAADGDEVPYGDITVTWDPVSGTGYYVVSLRKLDTDELILNHFSIDNETSAVLSASYFSDDADYRLAVGAVPAGFDSTDPSTGWKERVFHVNAKETPEYSVVTGNVFEEGEIQSNPLRSRYSSFENITNNGRYPSNGVKVEAYIIREQEEETPSAVAVTDDNGHFEMQLLFNTRYRLTFSKNRINYLTDTIIFTSEKHYDLDDILLRVTNMLEYGSMDLSGMESGLFAEYFVYQSNWWSDGYNASSSNKRNEGTVTKVDFNWVHRNHEVQKYNIMRDTVSGKDIRYIGEKFAAHFSGYLAISGLERSADGTLYLRLIADDGVKVHLESGQYYCYYSIDHDDWEKMSFWNNASTRITLSNLLGVETFELSIDYYNKGGTALLRMEYSNDGENWQTVPDYCFYNKGPSAQRTVTSRLGEGLAVSSWLLADQIEMRTYSTISGDVESSDDLLHTAGSKLAVSLQDWIRNTTYEALENNPDLVVIASANAGTEIKPTKNQAYQNTENILDGALGRMNGVSNFKDAIQESFAIPGDLIKSITGSMSSKQKKMVSNINKVLARVCYREMFGELPSYGSTNTERMWEAIWQKAEERYNNGSPFNKPSYSDSNSIEQMEYLCAYLYGTGNSAAKEAADSILYKFAEDSETIQREYGYNLGDFMWNLFEKVPLLGNKVAALHGNIDLAIELKKVYQIAKGDPEAARAMMSLAWSEMGDNSFHTKVLSKVLKEPMVTKAYNAGTGKEMLQVFYINSYISNGNYNQSATKDQFDEKLDLVRDGSVISVFNMVNGIDPERIIHSELLFYTWKYMKQELTGILNE